MARIVLGLGTSHTPQLSTGPETWPRHGQRDTGSPWLFDHQGKQVTYARLLANADPRLVEELGPARQQARHRAAQEAMTRLRQAFEEARPDVVVVFGDDQGEIFPREYRPALMVYWGERILNMPQMFSRAADEAARASGWAYGPEDTWYAVPSALGKHVIEQLVEAGFDIAQARELDEGIGMGHAFGFVVGRIMSPRPVPLLPVVINTLYAPNQPTPHRCWQLGQAVAAAIACWPGEERVAVVGSGGLSHFVIDEELDRRFIEALQARDAEAICSLPPERLSSGTGEIRSWIAAAATVEGLQLRSLEYFPCYRSTAGTGVGMGFAIWS